MNIDKTLALNATSELAEMVDGLDFCGVLTDEELQHFYSLLSLLKIYITGSEAND